MASPVDPLDARIVDVFTREPRVGVLEASRRLGVARGTVQARLDRMVRTGVIRGFGPELDPAALGYDVSAFATLELRQGVGHKSVADHLARIPEVHEAYTITGPADMMVRLVARSNADLQRVIDDVLAFEGIVRTSTVIALATQVAPRVLPLLAKVANDAAGGVTL
ncbi:Lrp/AsnC family transcriptional regulator [Actinopolymorpha alba]|uniref:Lrp/AsnC family transcriptional regulator n=1 Tax=Actinopolymorpha alba TaxID=533267 RepID=UPI00036DCF96|nr:Lrp/AsnC family transcriptional regulator [Actinopolymorpha alba]